MTDNRKLFRNENSNINSAIAYIFFERKSNEKQTSYFSRDVQSLELVRILKKKTLKFLEYLFCVANIKWERYKFKALEIWYDHWILRYWSFFDISKLERSDF